MGQQMSSDSDFENVEVRDNQAEQRYELEIDGHVAVIEYELGPHRILFLHTEVPKELEGHGIAAKMARFALEDARKRDLAVVPLCPFVASYIRHHQQYADLVSPGFQVNMKPEHGAEE